jgi:hypothetical protein
MLQHIINDQTFMKEQLLRLNATKSSSSSSSLSLGPAINIDDEFVDDYSPKPKISLKSMMKRAAESGSSVAAALESEKKAVNASRNSKLLFRLDFVAACHIRLRCLM